MNKDENDSRADQYEKQKDKILKKTAPKNNQYKKYMNKYTRKHVPS